jgi:hypothetical protein
MPLAEKLDWKGLTIKSIAVTSLTLKILYIHSQFVYDSINTIFTKFREDFFAEQNFTFIFLKTVCWILWVFLVHTRCSVKWYNGW